MEDEHGNELWLRYRMVDDLILLGQYRGTIQNVVTLGESITIEIIRQRELFGGIINGYYRPPI